MTRLTFIIVVVSYLLGSIPFGYLLVRIFRGQDVRLSGSGNIGATNVARTSSKGLAITTLLLDAFKGYAAVALAFWLAPRMWPTSAMNENPAANPRLQFSLAALAAFCAILGHLFPVWLKFKGGKGVAAAVGSFLAIAPLAVAVSLALFVVVVAATRYVSLGSMLGAAVFPFACWWLSPFTRTLCTMFLIAVSALLIIARHHENIRRLVAGTENRFR